MISTSNASNKTKNIDYRISILRAICILLVVFAHSCIIYKSGWNLYSTSVKSDTLNYICQFIYLFHMPLFVSLSGYLASRTFENNDMKVIIAKKIRRLIVPFIIFSAVYLIPIRYLACYSGYIQHGYWYNFGVNLLLGKDSGHLWFLPTLFLIFCLYGLLVKTVKNDKTIFIFSILLYFLSSYLPTYFSLVASNFVWFCLGCMINKEYENIKGKAVFKTGSLLLFTISTVLLAVLPYIPIINKSLLLLAATSAIIFFYMVTPDKKPGKIISTIEKNSFGVYLLHSPMIYFTFAYFPDINPLLMLSINFIVLGSIALLATMIIRKTKIKRILGE